MSYYYNYFLGAYDPAKDKYDLAGPFDKKGKYITILSKSSSFASDLHDDMYCLPEGEMSESMREALTHKDYAGNDKIDSVKAIHFSDLPSIDSPIKTGFVLKKDVFEFKRCEDTYITFEDCAQIILTPEQYSALAVDPNYGIRLQLWDDTDESTHQMYYAKDFMFYSWINPQSKEYEIWLLEEMAYSMEYNYDFRLGKGKKLVLLETEG